MSSVFLTIIYLLFFLSGAAALVYQIVWVRALTLVFGGSHLAVTAVLAIFMGGLAAGGYVLGRRADRAASPLRLYGWLELGIAGSALLFAGLMQVYPAIYVALARGRDESVFYLTVVRMAFSIVALSLPTMLMGGTLPVLSRFVSRHPERLRDHLAFLYGLNTLGAVLGALLAGFVFLRIFAVSTTLYIAVATSALIGAVSLAMSNRAAGGAEAVAGATAPRPEAFGSGPLPPARTLVLLGTGISGFCALGYEVLWTRVLTVAIGASVYGFTIMLVAFLAGIAVGSKAYGFLIKTLRVEPSIPRLIAWFGITQVMIGLTALVVTVYLRDIPANAVRLQVYFAEVSSATFGSRTWANLSLAFLYMVVPALFMGVAFPIAGEAVARQRRAVGQAVGEVLAWNTVGAILGSAVSGVILIRLFGIERSLQMLVLANIGLGLFVLASLRGPRWLPVGAGALAVGLIAFLAWNDAALRIWDQKYFAIFRSNQPEAFRTPEMIREAVENTDVLYYAEGVDSIVSVIKVKGGEQAFVTNGRVEASSHLQARQVQFTLGHLPMLLNRNPREVLVVGMGSGMTAGATAVHASVERVTLVEIEPKVLGVAKTFAQYNHDVLEHPKVAIVFNDGRNFLLTTDRMFDVITADPIHPWFRGAGYLYASEYFGLAARHLRQGGAIAQWLPLYELTPRDLASVVATFRQHFPHTLMWMTHYDAVIVGSASPFAIDEAALGQRIAAPAIASDLKTVSMGSATDFLSYFVMGTSGMARFGQNGILNTDDRPFLEFSAPFSIASQAVMAANIRAIAAHRESLRPYLKPAGSEEGIATQRRTWDLQVEAGRRGDEALASYLEQGPTSPELGSALRRLNLEYPWYAPGRFLLAEYQAALALEPRLLDQTSFSLLTETGGMTAVDLAAVLVPISPNRASLMFVDNRARVVYGQLYIDDYDTGDRAVRLASDVMRALGATYEREARAARAQQRALPPATETLGKMKVVIGSKLQGSQSSS